MPPLTPPEEEVQQDVQEEITTESEEEVEDTSSEYSNLDEAIKNIEKELGVTEEEEQEEEEQEEDTIEEEEQEEQQEEEERPRKRKRDEAAASLRRQYEETKKKVDEYEQKILQEKKQREEAEARAKEIEEKYKASIEKSIEVDPNDVPEVKEALNKFLKVEKTLQRLHPKFKSNVFRKLVDEYNNLGDPDDDGYDSKLAKFIDKLSDIDPRVQDREHIVLQSIVEGVDNLKEYQQLYSSARQNNSDSKLSIERQRFKSELDRWTSMRESVFEVDDRAAGDPNHWMTVLDSFRKVDAFAPVEQAIMKNLDAMFKPIPPVSPSEFESAEKYVEHVRKSQQARSKMLDSVPKLVATAMALGPIVSSLASELRKYKGKAKKGRTTPKPDRRTDERVSFSDEYGVEYDPESDELRVPTAADINKLIK